MRRIITAITLLAFSASVGLACSPQATPEPTPAGVSDLDRAISLEELAASYARAQDYAQAIPLYEEAITIREEVQGRDHPDLAAPHSRLGNLYFLRDAYPSSLEHYERAVAIGEKDSNHSPLALAEYHANLGKVHHKLEAYDDALEHYSAALEIRQREPGVPDLTLAASHDEVAGLYFRRGAYRRAADNYQAALDLRRVLPEVLPLELARSHDNVAQARYQTGEYPLALHNYRESLRIRKGSPDEDLAGLAATLNNLGALYYRLGDYGEAIPLLQNALDTVARSSQARPLDVASAHNNLGDLYFTIGNCEQARTHFEAALGEVRGTIPRSELSILLNNLGAALVCLREYQQSIRLFEQAREALGPAGGSDASQLATVINNLAALYRRQGEVERALELHREAVRMRRPPGGDADPLDLARSLNNLAALYFRMGKYQEALPRFQEALELRTGALGRDHPDTASLLTSLGVVHASLGEPERALELFKEAIEVEDQVFSSVFGVVSEEQKLWFARAHQKTYQATLDLVLRHFREDPEEVAFALGLVLKRKGMVFDAQSRAQESLAQNLSGEALQEWRQLNELRGRLANLLLNGHGAKEPGEYQESVAELKDAIARKERVLMEIIGPFVPGVSTGRPAPAALARRLPPNAVLVEFVRLLKRDEGVEGDSIADRYLAFVLDRDYQMDGVRLVDLGSARQIDLQVRSARENIEDEELFLREPRAYHQKTSTALEDLYRLLLGPLEASLGQSQKVILSPDGQLNQVPFAALRSPEGRYLVETHTISYVASGRDLLAPRPAGEPASDLLVAADPDYAEDGVLGEAAGQKEPAGEPDLLEAWTPLPGTRAEAKVVAQLVRGDRKEVLLQAQATEEAVLSARSPRILHLATHGFFLDDAPVDIADLTSSGIPSGGGQQRGPGDVIKVTPLLFQDSSPESLLSAMSRSGLVFAGANHGDRVDSGNDGFLTALEVTSMDLSSTRLVVLSACDTALGGISNGEGVFGLRRAFALTGARNLMMTLWPIGNEVIPQIRIFYQAVEDDGVAPEEALQSAQVKMIARIRQDFQMGLGEPIAPVRLWAPFILQRSP